MGCNGKGVGCLEVLLFIGAIVGLISMIAVGSTVVREYSLAKDFVPTECRLLNMDRSLGFRSCQYCYTTYTSTRRQGHKTRRSKTKCRPSSFPCVQMQVSYHDNYMTNRTATFFEDVIETTRSLLCSFYHCSQNVFDNEVFVDHKVRLYQQIGKNPFLCYHNKAAPGRVIGHKIHTYTEALHGMLWPGLLMGGCILGLIYRLCVHHPRKATESRRLMDGDASSALGDHGDHMDSVIGGNKAGGHSETMPLKGPTGVNMGPIPGGYTGAPEPIPTQPYHPGGGPGMYPPSAPLGPFDPAYPPQQYPPGPPGPYQQPQGPGQYPPPQGPPQYPPPQGAPEYPPPQGAPQYPPPQGAPQYPPPQGPPQYPPPQPMPPNADAQYPNYSAPPP